MLKPLMQLILDEELKVHPEKERVKEEKAAELGQDLLDKLWQPEEKPSTFWGKVKSALSDEVGLPQKLFNRMIDFRVREGLSYKKEEMQRIMFYATKAFCKGTDILAAGCYLFHHNPQAFQKYATSSEDFNEDVRQSTFDEENVFMPAIGISPPVGIAMIAGQSEQEECRAEDRRPPLRSFAPIRFGYHPSQEKFQGLFEHYHNIFSEPSMNGFKTNPYRYEPLKKLLYTEQPESRYPVSQHKAIVVALNEFNRRLEREPVKVCSHKNDQPNADKQKTI